MTKKSMICLAAWAALTSSAGLPAVASALQPAVATSESQPLVLDKTVTIPDVPTSPYADALAIDLVSGKIFATPQGAKAVAVIDLGSSRVVRMIPGFSKLHAVLFDQPTRRLFVSDGTTGELKIFNGDDYSLLKVIPLAVGADSIARDSGTGLIYVANGGDDAKMDHSLVSVVDPVHMVKVTDIRIAASGIEGIAIDPAKQRLYASLVNDSAIAVVDLKKNEQVVTWKLPGEGHSPFAVLADSARGRVYVTSREDLTTRERPVGAFFVFDSESGRIVASLVIGGWADAISLDQKRARLYVTSGVGWINTFRIEANGGLTRLPDVEIPIVAKHSLYSSELDRLFVDVPKMALTEAQVLAFKPVPESRPGE